MKYEELQKLKDLQNDILDAYIDKCISGIEMQNILEWTNRIIAKHKEVDFRF